MRERRKEGREEGRETGGGREAEKEKCDNSYRSIQFSFSIVYCVS